jgi:sugar O-acyltransferase (sialic acid O-acetyltransferase NeuD family)
MNAATDYRTRELVVIGAGGFGAVAAAAAESINATAPAGMPPWDVIGYADCDPAKRGTRHAGRLVHGTIEETAQAFGHRKLWFVCAIGDNRARAQIAGRAARLGWQPATLVHPSAVLDRSVEIGAGAFLGPLVVAAWAVRIGAHVVIDAHVSIGHNAVLLDYCEVFGGARINGNCQVGEFALIGCNATLLPGTLVGRGAVVGANSLAHGIVEPDATLVGAPARVIRRSNNGFSAQPRSWAAMEGDHGEHDQEQ